MILPHTYIGCCKWTLFFEVPETASNQAARMDVQQTMITSTNMNFWLHIAFTTQWCDDFMHLHIRNYVRPTIFFLNTNPKYDWEQYLWPQKMQSCLLTGNWPLCILVCKCIRAFVLWQCEDWCWMKVFFYICLCFNTFQ